MISLVTLRAMETINRPPRRVIRPTTYMARYKAWKASPFLLPDHQQPFGGTQPSGRVKVVVAPAIGLKKGPDPFMADQRIGSVGGDLHEVAPGPGSGLISAPAVKDIGLACPADADLFHHIAEDGCVDGGPEDPGPAGRLFHHRDDKMGAVPVAQKNIADIDAVVENFPEPFFFLVNLARQFVRAVVRHVHPLGVEDAQVGKSTGFILKIPQDVLQVGVGGEILITVSVGNKLEIALAVR